MPEFRISSNSSFKHRDGKFTNIGLKTAAFDSFNPSVLGLGDIGAESIARTAVAASFDLQEFTNFCKQMEPQFSVPVYLSGFLSWIFTAIKAETKQDMVVPEGVLLWHELPFFVKFMGDGLLILWDTSGMSKINQQNLIVSCSNIVEQYESKFLPGMRRNVVDASPALRCGIAKGTVFSVGNGEDYVGSCINVATRLQKLPGLSIAFSKRGFDPETGWRDPEGHIKDWVLKKTSIRGIGEHELIYVRKLDFEKLSKDAQKCYADP
ncbi:MAG: hypothetical protein ABSE62_08530 [Chthoniobacteraceae bacterium]|jgi:hypothetical protein